MSNIKKNPLMYFVIIMIILCVYLKLFRSEGQETEAEAEAEGVRAALALALAAGFVEESIAGALFMYTYTVNSQVTGADENDLRAVENLTKDMTFDQLREGQPQGDAVIAYINKKLAESEGTDTEERWSSVLGELLAMMKLNSSMNNDGPQNASSQPTFELKMGDNRLYCTLDVNEIEGGGRYTATCDLTGNKLLMGSAGQVEALDPSDAIEAAVEAMTPPEIPVEALDPSDADGTLDPPDADQNPGGTLNAQPLDVATADIFPNSVVTKYTLHKANTPGKGTHSDVMGAGYMIDRNDIDPGGYKSRSFEANELSPLLATCKTDCTAKANCKAFVYGGSPNGSKWCRLKSAATPINPRDAPQQQNNYKRVYTKVV